MLGSYYETYEGQRCDFIGVLDLYTVGSKDRMIGNYCFTCEEESGGSTVVGFENHSGRTMLGSGVRPLGRVLSGYAPEISAHDEMLARLSHQKNHG